MNGRARRRLLDPPQWWWTLRASGVAVLLLEAAAWLVAYVAAGDGAGRWRLLFAVLAVCLAVLGWLAPGSTGVALMWLGLLGAVISVTIVVAADVGGRGFLFIMLPTAVGPLLASACFFADGRSWTGGRIAPTSGP